MTGSQNASTHLSQGQHEIANTKDKSPTLDPGEKTTNFIRNKLLTEIRNSPSAAGRLRAIRLLKEKNQNPNEPDLYRDELVHVTEEERAYAEREVTLEELFQGICLFIDVRTDQDNRSGGIQEHLSSRGIKVTTDIKTATHIIFKDGLKSTFVRGRELNLPFVSVLWIEDCKKFKALVDYKNYPVLGIERYDDPILSKQIKRKRSMQPAPTFVPRTPKRKRRAKVSVEKPLIQTDVNKTPIKSSDCTLKTPKTIEVTVRAKSHARAQVTVQKNRQTIVYSSDEMEVSDMRNEVFTIATTPVPKGRRQSRRQTRKSCESIVLETPDVQKNEEEEMDQVQEVILPKAPINSTRFSAIQDTVPHFEANDISSIILNEESCALSSPVREHAASPEKQKTPIIEETKVVRKPRRKRKLFNPNLTPQEVDHDEKSEAPSLPPVRTPPSSLSPVRLTKTGSKDVFELAPVSQELEKVTQTQNVPMSQNIPSTQEQRRRYSRVFVATGIDKDSRTLLKTCVKQLSRTSKQNTCEIQSFIDKRATHLIMQEPYTKTQKVLLAILHGIWILNIDYLKACLERKTWLPEESYEVKNFLTGISLSRAEREIFGSSYKMRLFSGIKIYVCPELSAGAPEIREFIELSNGKLVEKPEDANYQIRDEVNENLRMDMQVGSAWITESIGAGHCKNVRNYLLAKQFCSQILSMKI